MADQDPEVIRALVRLMSHLDDMSELQDGEIVRAIREARESRTVAQQRGTAELRRRGWSYRRIAQELGVNQAQPFRWLQDEPQHPGGQEES